MKKTKKALLTTLSFILFLAIMMTTTIIPVSADGVSPVVIHYYNENNWQNPYLYYYIDNNNPVVWPGVAMTDDGDGWYSYTVSDYTEVRAIFSNNGSNQDPGQNEPGYLISGEKWYKNGTLYSTDPDLARLKIHYYNYNAWNSPYIYYYTDGSNPVTWPGAAMTADGDGWYTYEITGYESARVIFSNNGSNQVPAQNQPGYLVESESWYRNGTWTTTRPEGICVYFYKPANWSAPNIYYYLNNNDTGPAWPGTAMDEISEGWYSYNITKYDSAKVMFNDGTNQIPAQNQPGLDAEGIMWYKNGIWCDSETDTDEDELPDYMELVLGTNINGTDSDSDGLPDGFEVLTLGTDPTLADSDSNNVSDAAEDADSDKP